MIIAASTIGDAVTDDAIRASLRRLEDKMDKVVEEVGEARKDVAVAAAELKAHTTREEVHCVPPCSALKELRKWIWGSITTALAAALGALWALMRGTTGGN